jgi:hypothetical protein
VFDYKAMAVHAIPIIRSTESRPNPVDQQIRLLPGPTDKLVERNDDGLAFIDQRTDW